MGYTDLARAHRELGLDVSNEAHVDDLLMLQAIDEESSRLFDEKAFGQRGGATRSVTISTDPYSIYLYLETPVRSVSAIAITGDYAETLDAEDYALAYIDDGGAAMALRRIDGYAWPANTGRSAVSVTADWADTPPTDTASLVVDAVTWITTETYRQRKTSAQGEIGPDGFTVRPRNPWNYEVVKAAIAAYGQPRVVTF